MQCILEQHEIIRADRLARVMELLYTRAFWWILSLTTSHFLQLAINHWNLVRITKHGMYNCDKS